ncbi:hypothetical protein F4818DRAFT_436425 [Hypoxylon cercidicola]|nr:hypothetical protein F4818DRAFT_436425 [Hypoxylon cercidicola]
MASSYFPLLRCPREIRDMIYHEALCAGEFDKAAPYGIVATDRQSINTALLRVDKQVSEEAIAVMMKNGFIRVIVYGIDLVSAMHQINPFHIPLVDLKTHLFGDPVPRNGVVMTHHIRIGPPSAFSQCFTIYQRHFHMFCRALALVDSEVPGFSTSATHQVKIHNVLVGNTLKRLDTRKQESLVAPYRKYLWFSTNFVLGGPVSLQLIGQVVTEVKRGITTNPHTFLENIRRQTCIAVKCFNCRDWFGTAPTPSDFPPISL